MTKQQITRLSKVKRLIVNSNRGKAVEVVFLNAEQYNDMKPQLDKPFGNNGLKHLIFADGEKVVIDAETVVLIDDL